MTITIRLVVSWLVAAVLVASVFSYIQVANERERLTQELQTRAVVLGESLREPLRDYLAAGDQAKLRRRVERFGDRTQAVGIAVYDTQAVLLASTPVTHDAFSTTPALVWEAIVQHQNTSATTRVNGKAVHLLAIPLEADARLFGALLLFHDAAFIDARLEGIWRTNFFRLLVQLVLISMITVVVVRWTITGPIAQVAHWMRGLRTGKPTSSPRVPRGDFLGPVATEVSLLAKSLATARESAQQEARLRIKGESLWTAERLKEHIRTEMNGKNLFVVSNREPYMHMTTPAGPQCIVPAGGLVTALDPILRACSGIWIAHGSGTADRDTADQNGRLPVPPEDPSYTLRRIFLSKEEEEGYYYGFSNEGIWPLCHITHTRPQFVLNDWIQYQRVNQKFADYVLEEIAGEEAPLVLIQDYHFALLPLLIKAKRPDARTAIFWHIPWPNPEVFGICPWKQELLLGLLGSDLIGFHIQFHCNNFLGTVDRFLESKINWDQFTVERNRQVTMVRPFPISVADVSNQEGYSVPFHSSRQPILQSLGISARHLGVGVDRIDYTKGILERFRAVERFLEKYPDYVSQFTFVELGAPSRVHIKRYHDLIAELDETVDRINWKYQTKHWKPIVFLKAHHDHKTIDRYYRAADLCMVTSLHDGMNMVAKEFVASRSDEDGVLILSQFAGAAIELTDALVVNPYDCEEMADAICKALTMDQEERRSRMRELRQVVKQRNVYRWAANIITTLSHLRITKQPSAA